MSMISCNEKKNYLSSSIAIVKHDIRDETMPYGRNKNCPCFRRIFCGEIYNKFIFQLN